MTGANKKGASLNGVGAALRRYFDNDTHACDTLGSAGRGFAPSVTRCLGRRVAAGEPPPRPFLRGLPPPRLRHTVCARSHDRYRPVLPAGDAVFEEAHFQKGRQAEVVSR